MDAEKVTVQQLAEALDRWAPWAGAESWDNVGVLAGADAPFSAVLCALDITPAVVCEAVRRGCGAVVSHHPVIFSPLKALMPGTAPYLLAQHGVAAVCAHTNLDKAAGGVGDALAASLGLSSIEPCGEYCRRGALPPMCRRRWVRRCALQTRARRCARWASFPAQATSCGPRRRPRAATLSSPVKWATTTRWMRWRQGSPALSARITPPSASSCRCWHSACAPHSRASPCWRVRRTPSRSARCRPAHKKAQQKNEKEISRYGGCAAFVWQRSFCRLKYNSSCR